jgi:hypothetical protein
MEMTSMKKNFIKTTDGETAQKFVMLGFKLISQIGNVYTFLNEQPQNITFESIDETKFVYDNILSL